MPGEVKNEVKVMDVFVRAKEPDGTIQIAIADPELPYGSRPVEVTLITRGTAANLIAALARMLVTEGREGE